MMLDTELFWMLLVASPPGHLGSTDLHVKYYLALLDLLQWQYDCGAHFVLGHNRKDFMWRHERLQTFSNQERRRVFRSLC